ncbi:MAG: formate C-acetyltransferase/glycerol dehydratase family glycyl radical enzyme [Candidatus Thorarchaeota archaeon]|nr:MAG: formate C-acetyltransferase/glycerol dehydratase family glycyl radical enzyme [Candidatus Thorarchaeota archaeon]
MYGAVGLEMTARTLRIKQRMLESKPTISSERAVLFTEYIKDHMSESTIIRLAGAFAHVLDKMTLRIEPEELIVGNMGPTPRSCQVFPEYSWGWINEELDRFSKRRTERFSIDENDKEKLREVFEFWKGKSTAEIAGELLPEESVRASKAGLFTIGAPGTGIGHVIVDYPLVINKGLNHILSEVRALENKNKHDENKREFYQAARIQIEAVIRFAERFSGIAKVMATKENDKARRNELLEISRICAKVPALPAESFHEALQSFWFIHLLVQTESNGHSMSTGRFDQYLHPYLQGDLKNGKIDRADALELLEMLWVKFTSLIKLRNEYYSIAFAGHPMFQNLTVGGEDAQGNDVSNELTELVLEATANIRVTQPTVSYRWHKKTPKHMKLKVVDVISKGLGMPGLFNDEIIIPLMVDKGTDRSEAYNYAILGCVEPIIGGKTDPRPNIGYVNLPKILEITLNNGRNPKNGELAGRETGDPRKFKDFKQLWRAYEEQIDYAIELLTRADRIAAGVLAEHKPTPFISALLEGCIESGLTMQEGGTIYNSGGIMGVGVAIVADSLEILRKYVFERKELTMEDILSAIEENFENHEELRVRLENDPDKYGNDIERVDFLARDTGRAFCESIQSRMTTRNGPYHAALFSVSMYIPQGETLGATPDGRKAGHMLSDGVSPTQNRDTHGPTAAMKSVARLDHSLCYNGTLYNMKFTPDFFDTTARREKFLGMVDAYFRMGGFHVQFNVVSREMLEDAKVNPLQHRDLIVRVAGYSAYFIELDPFVQDEVIARTEFSSHSV